VAVVGNPVGGQAVSRAHQDLQVFDVRGGDMLQRQVEHRLMVGGGVRASVPRPQRPPRASRVSSA
jgi:hypothetical protein